MFYVLKDNNTSISALKLPNDFKEADIIPIYKKNPKLSKKNYWPKTNVPSISKMYERHLYNEKLKKFENRFSKFRSGFRKGYIVHGFAYISYD